MRSRTVAASEPDKQKATELGSAITSQQLVELITRLTSKEGDGEKPRTKEAESIKLNDMPDPETYRQWRIMLVMKSSLAPTQARRRPQSHLVWQSSKDHSTEVTWCRFYTEVTWQG